MRTKSKGRTLPNNVLAIKTAEIKSNSAAIQSAIDATIAAQVAAIKAAGDRTEKANAEAEKAAAEGWTVKEGALATLADASAKGDWQDDQIAHGIKAALIASYGKEREAEKIGTVARLRSEMLTVMKPAHRAQVANVFKAAAAAYDAETAAIEKAKKEGKEIAAPLHKLYQRRYHMMVTRVRHLSPDTQKVKGGGVKVLRKAAPATMTARDFVTDAAKQLAEKAAKGTTVSALGAEYDAIVKRLAEFATKIKKEEKFSLILATLRAIKHAELAPSAPNVPVTVRSASDTDTVDAASDIDVDDAATPTPASDDDAMLAKFKMFMALVNK